jgi:secondary thiamine-phosphate synthase enzyme
MIVHHATAQLELDPVFDAADLSQLAQRTVKDAGVRDGTLTIFCEGSTGAVTTIEYESGCLKDLRDALERMAPSDAEYAHNLRWGDGNGFSHLRAALVGPSLTVPIADGRPCFSTWQQPILVNFDNRRRRRRVRLTVVGV